MMQATPGTVLHRRVFLAGTVVMGAGWIAVLVAAAMGEPAPWPGWLVMVANTGIFAASPLVRSHPKGVAVIMMLVMMLSAFAIIGMSVK